MKIAISGKGGAGKTTLAAGLARFYAEQGRRVIAIDADADANLAMALGATPEQSESCQPLSEMADLIEERTGARPGTGGMFMLNPDVSDVPEKCGLEIDGVSVLRMGTVETGASGCLCSASSFLQAFIRHLLLDEEDVVIMDMEAGVEHLGRGTAKSVDVLLIVVEPTPRAVQTAHMVKQLAADMGVSRLGVVGNKVSSAEDVEFLESALGGIPLLATIHEVKGIREAERKGVTAFDADPEFAEAVRTVSERLSELVA